MHRAAAGRICDFDGSGSLIKFVIIELIIVELRIVLPRRFLLWSVVVKFGIRLWRFLFWSIIVKFGIRLRCFCFPTIGPAIDAGRRQRVGVVFADAAIDLTAQVVLH